MINTTQLKIYHGEFLLMKMMKNKSMEFKSFSDDMNSPNFREKPLAALHTDIIFMTKLVFIHFFQIDRCHRQNTSNEIKPHQLRYGPEQKTPAYMRRSLPLQCVLPVIHTWMFFRMQRPPHVEMHSLRAQVAGAGAAEGGIVSWFNRIVQKYGYCWHETIFLRANFPQNVVPVNESKGNNQYLVLKINVFISHMSI